ncbi:MAG: hypothetical protein J5986_11235 [Roseburia sp.]|nr:hypothetical protein [Roseburia sp.]
MSSTDIGTLTALVAFIGIFVEISPLKINPLSAVIQWFGNTLNKDTRKQLASISLKLEEVSERIDKIELNDMRSAILDFSNSCMNERRHTKEEFEHVIDLHTQYEEIISEKGLKNGRVDLAFRYISELYTKCLNENSFLDS